MNAAGLQILRMPLHLAGRRNLEDFFSEKLHLDEIRESLEHTKNIRLERNLFKNQESDPDRHESVISAYAKRPSLRNDSDFPGHH